MKIQRTFQLKEDFYPSEIHLEMILEKFHKQSIPVHENSMIAILEDKNSSIHSKQNAAIILRNIGSELSIKSLKENIFQSNKDLQAICILTIAQIMGALAIDYLFNLLTIGTVQKNYVLWALFAIDEPKTAGKIESFIESCLKSDQRPNSKKNSRIAYGLVIIENYGVKSPKREEILSFYLTKWDSFSMQEQKILQRNTNFFKSI
jgi:hypothetical protein